MIKELFFNILNGYRGSYIDYFQFFIPNLNFLVFLPEFVFKYHSLLKYQNYFYL